MNRNATWHKPTASVVWHKTIDCPALDEEVIIATENGLFHDVEFATWNGKDWINLVTRAKIEKECVVAWCYKPKYNLKNL